MNNFRQNGFMPNNNQFYGMNYNSYPHYQQSLAQQQMQIQAQRQTPFETPIQDLRFVTSEEAKAYIVMPNCNALLIDQPSKVAYLKSADAMGNSSIKFFKFEEIDKDGKALEKKEDVVDKPTINLTDYVKKDDLKELPTRADFNALVTKINNLRTEFLGVQNGTK